MYLTLDIDELVEIGVHLIGIFVHKLLEGLALDEIKGNSPLAVDHRYLMEYGGLDEGVYHSGLTSCVSKCRIKAFLLIFGLIVNIYGLSVTFVDVIDVAVSDEIFQFHRNSPFQKKYRRPVRVSVSTSTISCLCTVYIILQYD